MGEVKKYDKLIRDRIPEIIESNNAVPTVVVAGDEEYSERLIDKLDEESTELKEATGKAEQMNELADILEVLRAFSEYQGIEWGNVEQARINKAEERGGFTKRLILKEVKEK